MHHTVPGDGEGFESTPLEERLDVVTDALCARVDEVGGPELELILDALLRVGWAASEQRVRLAVAGGDHADCCSPVAVTLQGFLAELRCRLAPGALVEVRPEALLVRIRLALSSERVGLRPAWTLLVEPSSPSSAPMWSRLLQASVRAVPRRVWPWSTPRLDGLWSLYELCGRAPEPVADQALQALRSCRENATPAVRELAGEMLGWLHTNA